MEILWLAKQRLRKRWNHPEKYPLGSVIAETIGLYYNRRKISELEKMGNLRQTEKLPVMFKEAGYSL